MFKIYPHSTQEYDILCVTVYQEESLQCSEHGDATVPGAGQQPESTYSLEHGL